MVLEYGILALGAFVFYLGLRDVLRSQVRAGGAYPEKVQMMSGADYVLAVIQILVGLVLAIIGLFQVLELANISEDQLRIILYIGIGTLAGTFILGTFFSGKKRGRR